MRNYILPFLLVLGFFTVAQEKWSITFRPSLHFPKNKVFNVPLRLGNGADLNIVYSYNLQSKFYTGLTHNQYDTDENYEEENINLRHRGMHLGYMYFFTLLHEQKSPFYLRAGMTYTSIKTTSREENFNIGTDWSIGTQLGIGWKVQPSVNWFILPELQYSNFSNAYILNGQKSYINLSHMSISIGLMHSF